MPEYYISHEPKVIVAEVPGEEMPETLEGPLEAEEWVNGWIITAPARPSEARGIMGGLAKAQGSLPQGTLLLYPYDEASLVDVIENWMDGLNQNPELAAFIGEEIEDNPASYENLILAEKTLWRGIKEIIGFVPEGKQAIQPLEAYEALLERALDDFRTTASHGIDNIGAETVHRLSNEAKKLLIKDKRKALLEMVNEISGT